MLAWPNETRTIGRELSPRLLSLLSHRIIPQFPRENFPPPPFFSFFANSNSITNFLLIDGPIGQSLIGGGTRISAPWSSPCSFAAPSLRLASTQNSISRHWRDVNGEAERENDVPELCSRFSFLPPLLPARRCSVDGGSKRNLSGRGGTFTREDLELTRGEEALFLRADISTAKERGREARRDLWRAASSPSENSF